MFSDHPLPPIDPSAEIDSNAVAAAAFASPPSPPPDGVIPPPTPPSPVFAAYFPGLQFMPISRSGGSYWTIDYGECGMAGQVGTNFTISGYTFNATTAQGGLSFWSPTSCYDSYYFVQMNQTRLIAPPSPSGVYREWTLNDSFLSSAVPPTWSASNLTTSLLHWQVNSAAEPFSFLPSAAAVCGPGNASITDCTPPAQGWYAVLLDPNGNWIDSYPTVPNGTGWSVLGAHVSSGDRILFVGAAGFPTDGSIGVPYWGEPAVFVDQVLTPT